MENEEMFKVELFFNEEKIEISLNSQYDFFINTVCNIIKITIDQMKDITLSYTDADGDNVILSNKDDYNIFYEQVSQKLVDNFRISINENSNLDENNCLINFLDYKDNLESQANNKYIYNNLDNNINDNISNHHNNLSNNNYNVPYENNIAYSQNEETYNNYKGESDDSNKIKESIPINDLIFEYKCSNCYKYPILCKIFYCEKCGFCLCQECEQNYVKHEHNLLRIDNKEEFRKIKDKENEVLDKKRKEKEKEEQLKQMFRQYNIKNNYNNNYNFRQPNPNSGIQYTLDGNRRNYTINYPNNNNYENIPRNNPQFNVYQNPPSHQNQPNNDYLYYQNYYQSNYPYC